MGRPRQHDASTAAALVDAAERVVQADGLDALTVRRIAAEVGTTTRAVYSLFGSKEGLVVALGRRAFEILGDGVARVPRSDDPAADLVEAGVLVFRRFALEHPSLFQLALQRPPSPEIHAGFRDAGNDALAGLRALVERAAAAGMLGGRPVAAVTYEFHALCEGLAALELRGQLRRETPSDEDGGEELWRDALTALVRGFGRTPTSG